MSLIKCYECEKEISDLASDCPSCGAPRHIIISIKKGDIESVKKYLSAGGGVNAQYENCTPLHTAICEGDINIVELLLADNANVNESNINGYKPIFSAISFRRKEILKLLITKGADVNVFEKKAELSPLFAALYSDEEGENKDILKVKMQKEIANILISNGADLNYQNKGGMSCLHTAAMFGNYDIADFLIDKGIDVNLRDGGGNTALDLAYLSLAHVDDMVENSLDAQRGKLRISDLLKEHGAKTSLELLIEAIRQGDIEVVKQHIAAGTDVNAKSELGTPLHIAAHIGLKEIAELLLANGADVNAQGKDGGTNLHTAVSFGHTEIVELLIAKGADVDSKDEDGLTPLHLAAREVDMGIVELLITYGADVNAKDKVEETPLDAAIDNSLEWDDSTIPDLLRKHGGKTGNWLCADKSIHLAASAGHIEAVRQHIDKGADVNAQRWNGCTPLDYAIEKNHTETADLLRKHGGKHGTIYTATAGGDAEAVKEFLTTGADVNAEKEGFTPLHYAARYGYQEIAELLIANDADVNAPTEPEGQVLGRDLWPDDEDGFTPLDLANQQRHSEIVDLLRKHGGKTSDWLNADESIHKAANAGHIEAVKQHLANGTDVNAKEEEDNSAASEEWTPLFYASCKGHVEIVELLIGKGANVNAKSYGKTVPLDLAIEYKHTDTAVLLRKHGGKTGEELKAEGAK